MMLYTFISSSLTRILSGVVFIAVLLLLLPVTASAQTTEKWYNKTEWTFSWGERALASAVAVDVTSKSGEEPFTVFKPPVESVTFSDGEIREGTQYFVLQFKEDGEWGDIFEQELHIDTTPPEMSIRVEYGDDMYPRLFVEASDALSGIEKYTVSVDGGDTTYRLSPGEVVNGYALSMVPAGQHSIVVQAHDNAGNVTAFRKTVRVGGYDSFWGLLENIRVYLATHPAEVYKVAIVFLSVMAVAGLCFGLIEHRAHKRARAEARREVMAMQNKISKVFSTLRREVLMLTTLTSKKSRVTKKEKEVVEKVTQALSDSKSIIEGTGK